MRGRNVPPENPYRVYCPIYSSEAPFAYLALHHELPDQNLFRDRIPRSSRHRRRRRLGGHDDKGSKAAIEGKEFFPVMESTGCGSSFVNKSSRRIVLLKHPRSLTPSEFVEGGWGEELVGLIEVQPSTGTLLSQAGIGHAKLEP